MNDITKYTPVIITVKRKNAISPRHIGQVCILKVSDPPAYPYGFDFKKGRYTVRVFPENDDLFRIPDVMLQNGGDILCYLWRGTPSEDILLKAFTIPVINTPSRKRHKKKGTAKNDKT